MSDNYLEVIFQDKIYIQRTPNSKFAEFTLDGIKVNTYEELPSYMKDVIDFNKKIKSNPLRYFDIQKINGQVIIEKIKPHPDIKNYIKIPEYIEDLPVVKINTDVVSEPLRNKLEQIHLPATLRIIEPSAFRHCLGLKYINIPDRINQLPDLCFEGCLSLKNIYLNQVTRLGLGVFYNCQNLLSVDISKVYDVDNNIFSCCSNLQEVILSKKLTYIPNDMFYNCKKLKKIVIPEKVTSILDCAFKNCENLTEVIFPEKLRTISKSAFENCKSLKEFKAPEKLDSIAECAFKNSGLEFLEMNKKSYIGDYAFKDCFKLKIINLYSNTKYKDNAFSYENKLKINFLPVEGHIPGQLSI